MKLCYIAPLASIHTERWLRAFIARGHQVHLIALPQDAGELDGIRLHRLPAGRPKVRFMQWVLAARRLLGQIQPDVLHAHYLTRYGWLAAATRFQPLVLTAWGSDVYTDPRQSWLARHLTGWALRQAQTVTADSADLRAGVIALGARPERARLSQWGVDTSVFRPDLDTARLRRQLAPDGGPVILSTRNIAPIYNHDVIVAALPTVLQAVPTARLVIKYHTCDQAYLIQVQQRVSELGVQASVRFVGPTGHAELATYYALADVFVSIASSDGTPVSLLEAMACGAAPVVSRLPSLQEWVTDGQNGYCVPPHDPAALADAIIRLLAAPDSRAQIARVNRRIVQERADHAREMQRVEAMYASLATQTQQVA